MFQYWALQTRTEQTETLGSIKKGMKFPGARYVSINFYLFGLLIKLICLYLV